EGFDIDLVKLIARELGVEAVFTNASFDGIFPALLAGKFDLVASAVTITPERREQMAFSRPYYHAGQLIATRTDGLAVTGFDQLAGHQVGVQINTTGQFVLEKQAGVAVRKYNSIDLALLDLQARRLDAVVTDAPVLRYMIEQSFDDLVPRGEPLTQEYYGLAMHPAAGDLRDAVDEALIRIDARGEYARLHQRWFGTPGRLPIPDAGAAGTALSTAPELLPALLRGLAVSLRLTLLGLLAGLPLGLVVGLARLNSFRPLSLLAGAYVELMRGTPLLVQIFAIYYVLPALGLRLPAWPSAVIALGLNSAAYIAEILRAGIASIDVGQMEGARSLGLGYGQAMRYVVLPQALRRVVPPLTNEAIALLKDTSLVSVVAISELTRTGSELAARLGRPTLVWPAVALFYLALTFPLSRLAQALERRWDTTGEKP
ncbi:MAG: ABC transporter permease subunit, partial [Armatimonadetes bacterium]|nr:ABC transporter permease subunit [Armatimonadota bacterium]